MEILIIIILSLSVLLFFIFFPKKKVKTKAQKQEELYISYKNIMEKELSRLKNDPQAYKEKKLSLLKSFAKELEFSIFFDKDEIYELIRNLSKEDF